MFTSYTLNADTMESALPRPSLSYPVHLMLTWLGVGLVLTLCDRFFHVSFGVLAYRAPLPTGQAWWVLPGFVFAAASMYLGARDLFARHCHSATPRQIATSLALFVAAYAASGLFLAHPQALLVGYVATWLARVALSPDRLVLLVFGPLLAVAGVVIEGLLMLTGDVAYSAPEIFHVPWWLGGLYLHGAFVVLQIVRHVEEAHGRLDPRPAR